MIYIHDTVDIRQDKPGIILMGKFDGFHKGHQRLLEEARRLKSGDLQIVLLTFSISPQAYITGVDEEQILKHEEKLARAEELGVDVLIEYPFTDEIRHMEAEAFLKDMIAEELKAAYVVAGADCRFGYMGRGDASLLEKESAHLGFTPVILDKVAYLGRDISSTRIRDAIRNGDNEDAEAML